MKNSYKISVEGPHKPNFPQQIKIKKKKEKDEMYFENTWEMARQ